MAEQRQFSEEVYREALKREMQKDVPDQTTINSLLLEFQKHYHDYGKTTVEHRSFAEEVAVRLGGEAAVSAVRNVTDYSRGVAERAEAFSPDEILAEGYEKRLERNKRLSREGFTPSLAGGTKEEKVAALAVGISEGVRRTGEIAVQGISIIVPDFVKAGLEEKWTEIKETPAMQVAAAKITEGLDSYSAWAKENPQYAESFETIIDVSAMLNPAARTRRGMPGTEKVKDMSAAAIRERKRKLVDKLMDPHSTKEARYDGNFIAETTGLRSTTYNPTARENRVRETLTDLKEFDPTDNYLRAENVVSNAIEKEAKRNIAFITRAGNPEIDLEASIRYVNSSMEDMINAPGYANLSAEAQRRLSSYVEKAEKIMREEMKDVDGTSGNTAINLYNARKAFDAEINRITPEGTLDPDVMTSRAVAARHVRNRMNDLLKENTPGDEVADSFDKMHNLMQARDHLSFRSIGLANNAISRLWKKIVGVGNLPSTPLALYATFAGATTAGATFGIGLAGGVTAAAAGAGVYGVLLAGSKVNRLRFLSMTLNATDKAIKAYTGDKNLLRELRVDRAIILDLLNQAREKPAEQEEEKIAVNQ